MLYQDVVHYLVTSLPVFQHTGGSAYKPGLQTISELDDFYGNPHRKYRTIHVAGTNGKGSVSHMLAAILQGAGYKTGLFTSPHLIDFRERIKVNGKMITEDEVVEFVTRSRAMFDKVQPSFFEMTTAMAFDHFAGHTVDIAVIETGMGGRLDATNIIRPVMSVITNISMDHTQFLGNNPVAIATEKAGVIKPGIPVVIGETQPGPAQVFEDAAKLAGSTIVFADRHARISRSHHTAEGQ
jgi:dihydrofolate synthase/folylpolyglutamate synthase